MANETDKSSDRSPADDKKELIVRHYDASSEYYGRRYDPTKLLTAERYSANYFRLRLMIDRLQALGHRRVYEVGVGDGTALAIMAQEGFSVMGCDIASGMVNQAKKTFRANELDSDLCSLGDIEKIDTIVPPAEKGAQDAVIAAGVLPHVGDELRTLGNVRELLRLGGAAMIEFRNKLFSLFTFNRYTIEFILDDLLLATDPSVKDALVSELDRRCAVDLPPPRLLRSDGKPDYDAIRARYHNPLELPELFSAAGLRFVRIHWYHYHVAPPMLEQKIGREVFRSESMRLEGRTDDWRGHFLCSAGVVEAVRDT